MAKSLLTATMFAPAVVLALALSNVTAGAQDAVVRKPLQKSEFPTDLFASHLMLITVAPGGVVARHTHPGIEMGYLQEGKATMVIGDQPEIKLKAGDSYLIPAGAPHSAKNTGTTPIKIIGTFVVEKAKPLAAPAP
jgi:quercetin dioxygenase-like cupin family protein